MDRDDVKRNSTVAIDKEKKRHKKGKGSTSRSRPSRAQEWVNICLCLSKKPSAARYNCLRGWVTPLDPPFPVFFFT